MGRSTLGPLCLRQLRALTPLARAAAAAAMRVLLRVMVPMELAHAHARVEQPLALVVGLLEGLVQGLDARAVADARLTRRLLRVLTWTRVKLLVLQLLPPPLLLYLRPRSLQLDLPLEHRDCLFH
jgi:hypothetical protein